MTLGELRKKVLPAQIWIDGTGCIEVLAPEGYSFNREMHGLVTDPQMHPEIRSKGELYQFVYDDFAEQTIMECEEDCGCMEEPEWLAAK